MADQTNHAAILPALGKDLELVTLPVPTPGASDVLIRSSVVAVNPIDRVRQLYGFQVPTTPKVLGSDTTGTIVAVGADVAAAGTFKVGDRVVAATDGFHNGDNGHESFQTFTVAPTTTTAKLADNVTFLQAAPVPVSIMTAGTIFFEGFHFTVPGAKEAPTTKPLPAAGSKPIVAIWGGASSVGSVTLQLARHLGFTVFTTASPRHHERLQKLGAEVVVDYSDPEAAVEKFLAAAGKREILYAVDAVNDFEKTVPFLEDLLLRSVAATGATAVPEFASTNDLSKYAWKGGLDQKMVDATSVWTDRKDIAAYLYGSGNLSRWLADGTIVPVPTRVVPGGLGGLQTALNEVKSGSVSGEKLVVEVA